MIDGEINRQRCVCVYVYDMCMDMNINGQTGCVITNCKTDIDGHVHDRENTRREIHRQETDRQ